MKTYLLLVSLAVAPRCQAQDKKHTFRIHLATTFGVGISGKAEEMNNGAFMASLALPLEFGKQWYLIPEVYGGAFRTPRYPDKIGFLFSSYPRLRHEAYIVRLGKGVKGVTPELSFRLSIGTGLLLVHEPCCIKYGKFSTTHEEVLYRTWVVPAQLDMRFRLTKREKSFLVFGGLGTPMDGAPLEA